MSATNDSETTSQPIPETESKSVPSSEHTFAKVTTGAAYTDPTVDQKLLRKMQDAYLKFLLDTVCGRCHQEVHYKRKIRFQGGVICPDCWPRVVRSRNASNKSNR